MRHFTPIRIWMGAVVAISLRALFAAVGASRPGVSLSVVGFETNTIAGSEIGRTTNLVYVCAIIRMTNCGTRPVTLTMELDTPGYTTVWQSGTSWSESPHFVCGLATSDRTLSPGQSIAFTAVVEPDAPCWISVPYRTSNFRTQMRRFLPAWLVQRVGWFIREPTATTPVIRLEAKNDA